MSENAEEINLIIKKTDPLYLMKEYAPGVANMINKISDDDLPHISNRTFSEIKEELLAELNSKEIDALIGQPSQLVKDFITICQTHVSSDLFEQIFQTWPISIPNNATNKSIFLYIVSLIHDSDDPFKTLRWATYVLSPREWHKYGSKANNTLKSACVCMKGNKFKKEDFYWATLSTDNQFNLYKVKENEPMKLIMTGSCSKLNPIHIASKKSKEKDGKNGDVFGIKIRNEKDEFLTKIYPVDPSLVEIWCTKSNNNNIDNASPKPSKNGQKKDHKSSNNISHEIRNSQNNKNENNNENKNENKHGNMDESMNNDNTTENNTESCHINDKVDFYFPCHLTTIVPPFPSELLQAFFYAITSDDMLVARALCDYRVVKVTEGIPLMNALIDIFSYVGKVNSLISMMVGSEFQGESLKHTTVLRGNSHLTNMFKVFYSRFGVSYYHNFLKKIVEFVDNTGDINLKDPEKCDEEKARHLFFTVLKNIIRSGPFISPEIRHMASVLKSSIGVRFNSKQATFNTLSSFFCLRFINPIMTDPHPFDKTFTLSNPMEKVTLPFSQLLQTSFNLTQIGGKFEHLSHWNDRLINHTLPQLINFVFSVAELKEDEKPNYPAPSNDVLIQSLELVLEYIGKSNGKFKERYQCLVNEDKYPSVSWNIGSFLMDFSKDNIAD